MSKGVENLIAEENAEIIRMLTDDEAIYVEAIFELDKEGKRVYDWEMMEVIFRQRMETLITLNEQAEKGKKDLENFIAQKIIENWKQNKEDE
jgi:hypothetical protein